ncbi:elicitor-responsive protein 3-like isoform X1 [Apium graveolens]|uniref:elicitor-responsive protein 3-like isoform X1 n=1 Tax=Apium graveolens TaxID=4045 RepID=UPI003D79D095
MRRGSLEVLLVGAKGLENSDFLSMLNPIIVCVHAITWIHMSSSLVELRRRKAMLHQEWDLNQNGMRLFCSMCLVMFQNYRLKYWIVILVQQMTLSVRQSNSFCFNSIDRIHSSSCSYIIPLEAVFEERRIPPTAYNVVKDQEFRGHIRVGLTFTPEEVNDRGRKDESYGGWKQSSY